MSEIFTKIDSQKFRDEAIRLLQTIGNDGVFLDRTDLILSDTPDEKIFDNPSP
jgi:hypothetical protein